jgi:hypothetical protein
MYSTQLTCLGCKDPCWLSPGSTAKHLKPNWQFSQKPRALVILLIIYIEYRLCSHLYSYAHRLNKIHLQSWKAFILDMPFTQVLFFSNSCRMWGAQNTILSECLSIFRVLLPPTLPSPHSHPKLPQAVCNVRAGCRIRLSELKSPLSFLCVYNVGQMTGFLCSSFSLLKFLRIIIHSHWVTMRTEWT